MPVTRKEIARILAPRLDGTPRTPEDLIHAAVEAGARTETLETIGSLPPQEYRRTTDLWPHLPGIPVGT